MPVAGGAVLGTPRSAPGVLGAGAAVEQRDHHRDAGAEHRPHRPVVEQLPGGQHGHQPDGVEHQCQARPAGDTGPQEPVLPRPGRGGRGVRDHHVRHLGRQLAQRARPRHRERPRVVLGLVESTLRTGLREQQGREVPVGVRGPQRLVRRNPRVGAETGPGCADRRHRPFRKRLGQVLPLGHSRHLQAERYAPRWHRGQGPAPRPDAAPPASGGMRHAWGRRWR